MENYKILIIDDEVELAFIVRDYLIAEGYQVSVATDGEKGLEEYKKYNPNLVILDIMLPKIEGTELCRIIRNESNIPIIMLSAKNGDVDKILSLGLGADEYITKPFSPGVLVAQVKAHLRRYTQLSKIISESNDTKKVRDILINFKSYEVRVNDKIIPLAPKEFDLLAFMMKNMNQVFTKEQLFNQVWGFDEFGDINTVTVHIRKIRQKIEKNPSNPKYIKTVWRIGYKFDGDIK